MGSGSGGGGETSCCGGMGGPGEGMSVFLADMVATGGTGGVGTVGRMEPGVMVGGSGAGTAK